MRDSNPGLFFSKKEKTRIISSIRDAEGQTSAEIRLHLEPAFKMEAMTHARDVFERIGMAGTEKHNGVLILLATRSKKFVVLGDKGIHEKVPPHFWDDVAALMARHFKEDRFADGIVEAILRIGEKLRNYFPRVSADQNELPDEISYSL